MAIKLGRNILAPSSNREPEYDTNRRDTGSYVFRCMRCPGDVTAHFTELIESAWNYERVLDPALLEQARRRFGIDELGKAHDGGFVSLRRVNCPECGAGYLVYAGVREPSNEWYQVTVQGLAELSTGAEGRHSVARGNREAESD